MTRDYIFQGGQYHRTRSLFGCGIPKKEFEAHYAELYEQSPEACYRIARAAERALFVIDIFRLVGRARLSRTTYDEYERKRDTVYWLRNITSLRVYLLFTCLDALTSQEEGGVRDRLQRLFDDIPSIILTGLTKHIKVFCVDKEVSEDPSENYIRGEKEFPVHGPSELRDSLFQFLYHGRRNPYTHDADTIAPLVESNNSRTRLYLYIHKHADGTEEFRKLYFEYPYYEANAILLIAYSKVLNMLNIEISFSLINSFLFGLTTRFAVYAFMRELHANSNILFAWFLFEQGSISSDEICVSSGQLKSLSQGAADNLEKLLSSDAATMLGRHSLMLHNYEAIVRGYRVAIEEIVSSIDSLNKWIAETERTDDVYKNRLREFIEDAQHMPSFHQLTSFAYNPRLRQLRYLAANPCVSI